MDLEKLRRSLLYRLESIDGESNFTVIEDKVNKLSHQIVNLKVTYLMLSPCFIY